MPYINKIVKIIDDNIASSQAASVGKLQKHCFKGLAKIGYESKDNTMKQYPIGMVSQDAIAPDDRFNLITYHRVIGSKQYSVNNNAAGSNYDFITDITPMMMVVIADFKKLNISDEQLEQIILPHLSYNLASDAASIGIRNGGILPTSTNFDSMTLFNQEHKNVQPFLKPNLIYFQIRYSIESTYKKGCFNNTICG